MTIQAGFITAATNSWLLCASRLVRSLLRSNPGARIAVYLEDDRFASAFQMLGAETRRLPEIRALGVPRARFCAYWDAIARGPFIWLDSDVIVVDRLDALEPQEELVACRDDLSGCPFIEDKVHPWPARPDLDSGRYFNAGVFASPASWVEFWRACYNGALDDSCWRSLMNEELGDNHFLCGMVADRAAPTRWVSEYGYNWRGLHKAGVPQVSLDAKGCLVHRGSGERLRLLHFAGIRDRDEFLLRLPPDVLAVVARAAGPEEEQDFLRYVNSGGAASALEPHVRTLLLRAALRPDPPPVDAFKPGKERQCLACADDLASIARTAAVEPVIWNGLRCGGSHLSVKEYVFLRSFVRRAAIAGVLEFGAGCSSVLFRREVKECVALEGWDGPWLAFARSQGCDARPVPFDPSKGGFEDQTVREACQAISCRDARRLVFIDSPPDTGSRLLVARQVARLCGRRGFIGVHDAYRDAEMVFLLHEALQLRVAARCASLRGLVILGRKGVCVPAARERDERRFDPAVAAKARFEAETLRGEDGSPHLRLKNVGPVTIRFVGDGGVYLSYHTFNARGDLVCWDGPRTVLPCDLEPGDELLFPFTTPSDGSRPVFDLVAEGRFWWSQLK
jgi:hypothetical protein